MAEYQLSPLAEADIRAIATSTFTNWGSDQARTYLESLDRTLLSLAANPGSGRPRDEIHVGAKSFPSGKHVIFYRISASGIEVARVLHQRMDIQTLFSDDF
ncbi:type II toxin-antitoxin system RelE/ParE family toxin [Rheinheimera riviphila]|uniref:Toxin n=1 Tax=Rheinheimera riviphila TaxID=1834037 RepID=A0A437QLT5_9GAMM|nr:type II toxin-antitoxin system RelE/ParE family toxin [Rheinheimera riviphila]RVU35484.1 type II toxin-antitoxin system RelE/ParE family toxin [Rheinheimera riviphila]